MAAPAQRRVSAQNSSERPAPVGPWRNPKTMAKWRARTSVLDESMGPRDTASQHLSQEQEHLAIALRKQGHLSLDDLMGQILETAALHRCLQRHGISRQPATQLPRRHGKFEETTLGFVHIDSAEMKVSCGRQRMFVGIDRITKFTHVAFFDRATKANPVPFLRQVPVAFPYRIHTVLTDNGMASTGQERFRGGVIDTCIVSQLRAHLQVQWRREKAYQAVPPLD